MEPTWHQYAWAAVLLGGKSARLIGASAAVFDGLADPRFPIRLGINFTSGLASRPWLRVVRQRSASRPPGSLTSPPRTLVEDTVLDLCAAATDDAAVIGLLTLSIPRLTSARKLKRALDRRVRIAHRSLMNDILAETEIGVQSPLEYQWIKLVERPHRLPMPTRPFPLPSGGLADGGYQEFRVLLELDGRRYHDGGRRLRDWRRDNLSSEDDWLTLRYGWHDTVIESCDTAGNLFRVLRRRGYRGRRAFCTNCRV